ncbi:ubiquitin carboxyl-terminal hydrolase L5 [Strigomonas culicis]|nr:ubiquitin carboxyl-terminal hydrolase L5 [Strigomonas culicis]|eukprot:EPY37047.1 ubiquitin carboxyl-terminal hydrolase L5 [Strigomonas culicis]
MVYFAQQVVPNACSTMALVNLLANNMDRLEVGSALKEVVEATQPLDPNSRGIVIGDRVDFRENQNSFAPFELYEYEGVYTGKGDVFHYVSFVYKFGAIWELDGLKSEPVWKSEATDANYKTMLMNTVQKRVDEIAQADKSGNGQGISFSLMAVVNDPIPVVEKQIAEATAAGQSADILKAELAALQEARNKGREENQRRRFNYNPMIGALLKALAEKGELQGILDELKSSALEKAKDKKRVKVEEVKGEKKE